jgi:hypothetical protein
MKTTEEVWSRYADYTRDVTEHGRKLAFGGFGVCWLFRDSSGHFPCLVLVAMALLLLYCLADLAHPFVAGIVYRHFIQRQEAELWRRAKSIEGEVRVPPWLDKPAYFLYLSKVAFLTLGFIALIFHVAGTALQR